jgi:hypothetical protein
MIRGRGESPSVSEVLSSERIEMTGTQVEGKFLTPEKVSSPVGEFSFRDGVVRPRLPHPGEIIRH